MNFTHWPRAVALCSVVAILVCGSFAPPRVLAATRIEQPWTARPTSGVATEEKTFTDRGERLSGTLYVPQGRKTFGAVVVLHGASSPLRSSPLYDHLKRVLPALGIAVFIYDRRGSGESQGSANSGDFTLLADDAVAAIHLLKKDPRIDPQRVGVWGLSQGGWLALLAAARSPEVRFAVAISAPLVTPDAQMMFSSTNTLRVFGYSQVDIEQMRATRNAVDDYMRGTDTREHAQKLVDEASTKPWFKYLYMGTHVSDRSVSTWRKEIANDPIAILTHVHVPLLVLYGAADPVVPVALSREHLQRLEPSHPQMRVSVIADADHGMQVGVEAKHLLDPTETDAERPNSEEYFATLAAWLTQIDVSRPLFEFRP